MMHTVLLDGNAVKLDPSAAIGKGGEADIYRIDAQTALKIFKQPDHPDVAGDPGLQKLARERLATQQNKLQCFPLAGLPPQVIQPQHLALLPGKSPRGTTAAAPVAGPIVGYSMRLVAGSEKLIRYSEADFRVHGANRATSANVTSIFQTLHDVVFKTHKAGVVIGDFNNLNVLVVGLEPFLIDIDSAQFGQFLCMQYTARYLDPLLAKPGHDGKPVLGHAHNEFSDWYAYTAMLMESLLLVHPYMGVYRPKGKPLVGLEQRPMQRISVFDPDVRYPKVGLPFEVLSDDLLHHFQRVFSTKDWRDVFPRNLLDNLKWTVCPGCGMEHARSKCPFCALTVPVSTPATTPVQVIYGTVTAQQIFVTTGTIITATVESGKLLYLYLDKGNFKREDGTILGQGTYDPQTRFRLTARATLLGKRDSFSTVLRGGQRNDILPADRFASGSGRLAAPVFDVNALHSYWVSGGGLWRDGGFGPERIGNVLANQTQMWVGSDFGFGFYRAGPVSVAFVFGAQDRVINDSVDLSPINGELLDATTLFSGNRAWFLTSSQEGENIVNRCTLIRADGKVEGTAQAVRGDSSWLGSLHSACAAGPYLFAATDEGMVRVEIVNGRIEQTRSFPDTEPFVSAGDMLLPGPGGIYVINRKEIRLLTIK